MAPSAERPYVLSRTDDIEAALGEWVRTVDTEADSVDAPATPLALRAWARHFADEHPSLFQLHREGVLRNMLPIASRPRQVLGVTFRVLSSPRNSYWQFGYPIGGHDVAATTATVLEQLSRRRDWDVLDLGPMLSSSPHATTVVTSGERLDMHPEVYRRKHDPIVVVRGTWDAYYAGLSGILRETIRRGERRLAREGQVTFVEYTGGPELEQRLREFYELESSGWKGRQGTSIANHPAVEAFYTDLAREAARLGCLRLYALRVDDDLVACDYCIAHGDVVHMLKIAYDERRASCSPGQVIRKLTLQRLFELREGMIYDLMTGGGDHSAYKLHWANDGREYIAVRLFNPATARGRLSRAMTASRRMLSRRRP